MYPILHKYLSVNWGSRISRTSFGYSHVNGCSVEYSNNIAKSSTLSGSAADAVLELIARAGCRRALIDRPTWPSEDVDVNKNKTCRRWIYDGVRTPY